MVKIGAPSLMKWQLSKYFHLQDSKCPKSFQLSHSVLFEILSLRAIWKNGFPNKQTFLLVILACTHLSEFGLGVETEQKVKRRGFQCGVIISRGLMGSHLKVAGDLFDARRGFDEMPVRNLIAWNVMISGYSQAECLSDVMKLYEKMRGINGFFPAEVTLFSLISGFGDLGLLQTGKTVHAHATEVGFEANLNVSVSLTAVYIACSCLDGAEKLFNEMVSKDARSWSTMIWGYVEDERNHIALMLFHKVISNTVILPIRTMLLSVIQYGADLGDCKEGMQKKSKYLVNESGELTSDVYLITALIYTCAKCAEIEIALELLDEVALVREDVVDLKNDCINSVIWGTSLSACRVYGDLVIGDAAAQHYFRWNRIMRLIICCLLIVIFQQVRERNEIVF